MMIIGVDPQEHYTSAAIDPLSDHAVGSIRIRATVADCRPVLKWAGQFEQRRFCGELHRRSTQE
jgi:hypothetical protein